jgi:hypothetical protein
MPFRPIPKKGSSSIRPEKSKHRIPLISPESLASTHSTLFVTRPLTWGVILASPVLYGIFIPLVLLDLSLTIYHWTVFPLLHIPNVQRKAYIRFDRHRLTYLPWIVKLTCSYCGYANGLLQYAVRLAGDTEAYFCPLKHQERTGEFHHAPHHVQFAEYGDAPGFKAHYQRDPTQKER